MLIAQLTDPHVVPRGTLAYDRVDTNRMLQDAIAAVAALRPAPDLVLLTGDLVDGGTAAEYAVLQELLAPLPMPVYVIPGNHDSREGLRRAFGRNGYLPAEGEFLQYVIEREPLRLIGLDTLIPGSAAGRLCAERLAWLEARLAEARNRPTVIFMHHPPFPTGIGHMDGMALEEAESFVSLLARNPQVERVLCGHVHRPIQIRLGGALVSIAPSVAHQVTLDLREEGPVAFTMEPPAYQLHLWKPGIGLISHTAYVRKYSQNYLFADGRPVSEPKACAGA